MGRTKVIVVDTNLDTHFLLAAPSHRSISELRELIREGHISCFPEHGDVNIDALVVEHDGKWYRVVHSLLVGQVFRRERSRVSVEVTQVVLHTAGTNTESKLELAAGPPIGGTSGLHCKFHAQSHDSTQVVQDAGGGKFVSQKQDSWERVALKTTPSKCQIDGTRVDRRIDSSLKSDDTSSHISPRDFGDMLPLTQSPCIQQCRGLTMEERPGTSAGLIDKRKNKLEAGNCCKEANNDPKHHKHLQFPNDLPDGDETQNLSGTDMRTIIDKGDIVVKTSILERLQDVFLREKDEIELIGTADQIGNRSEQLYDKNLHDMDKACASEHALNEQSKETNFLLPASLNSNEGFAFLESIQSFPLRGKKRGGKHHHKFGKESKILSDARIKRPLSLMEITSNKPGSVSQSREKVTKKKHRPKLDRNMDIGDFLGVKSNKKHNADFSVQLIAEEKAKKLLISDTIKHVDTDATTDVSESQELHQRATEPFKQNRGSEDMPNYMICNEEYGGKLSKMQNKVVFSNVALDSTENGPTYLETSDEDETRSIENSSATWSTKNQKHIIPSLKLPVKEVYKSVLNGHYFDKTSTDNLQTGSEVHEYSESNDGRRHGRSHQFEYAQTSPKFLMGTTEPEKNEAHSTAFGACTDAGKILGQTGKSSTLHSGGEVRKEFNCAFEKHCTPVSDCEAGIPGKGDAEDTPNDGKGKGYSKRKATTCSADSADARGVEGNSTDLKVLKLYTGSLESDAERAEEDGSCKSRQTDKILLERRVVAASPSDLSATSSSSMSTNAYDSEDGKTDSQDHEKMHQSAGYARGRRNAVDEAAIVSKFAHIIDKQDGLDGILGNAFSKQICKDKVERPNGLGNSKEHNMIGGLHSSSTDASITLDIVPDTQESQMCTQMGMKAAEGKAPGKLGELCEKSDPMPLVGGFKVPKVLSISGMSTEGKGGTELTNHEKLDTTMNNPTDCIAVPTIQNVAACQNQQDIEGGPQLQGTYADQTAMRHVSDNSLTLETPRVPPGKHKKKRRRGELKIQAKDCSSEKEKHSETSHKKQDGTLIADEGKVINVIDKNLMDNDDPKENMENVEISHSNGKYKEIVHTGWDKSNDFESDDLMISGKHRTKSERVFCTMENHNCLRDSGEDGEFNAVLNEVNQKEVDCSQSFDKNNRNKELGQEENILREDSIPAKGERAAVVLEEQDQDIELMKEVYEGSERETQNMKRSNNERRKKRKRHRDDASEWNANCSLSGEKERLTVALEEVNRKKQKRKKKLRNMIGLHHDGIQQESKQVIYSEGVQENQTSKENPETEDMGIVSEFKLQPNSGEAASSGNKENTEYEKDDGTGLKDTMETVRKVKAGKTKKHHIKEQEWYAGPKRDADKRKVLKDGETQSTHDQNGSFDVFEFDSQANSQASGEKEAVGRQLRSKSFAKKIRKPERISSRAVDKVLEADLLDPAIASAREIKPKKTARKRSDPENWRKLLSKRLLHGSPVKDSFRNQASGPILQSHKNLASKVSAVENGGSIQKKDMRESGIACPLGCGRLYSGKTSAWYRHRQSCSGKAF